jgi:hypothetical protein
VEFEDGLSIPVLKNRATRHCNGQLEIIKFLKSQAGCPLYFKLRSFQTLRCVPRCLKDDQKSNVMEMLSEKFYWVNGTMFKLYGGGAAKACIGLGMTNLVPFATE